MCKSDFGTSGGQYPTEQKITLPQRIKHNNPKRHQFLHFSLDLS